MKTGGMDFANIVHEINPAFPRTLLAAVPRPAQIFFRIIALPSADMHHCKGVQQSIHSNYMVTSIHSDKQVINKL